MCIKQLLYNCLLSHSFPLSHTSSLFLQVTVFITLWVLLLSTGPVISSVLFPDYKSLTLLIDVSCSPTTRSLNFLQIPFENRITLSSPPLFPTYPMSKIKVWRFSNNVCWPLFQQDLTQITLIREQPSLVVKDIYGECRIPHFDTAPCTILFSTSFSVLPLNLGLGNRTF